MTQSSTVQVKLTLPRVLYERLFHRCIQAQKLAKRPISMPAYLTEELTKLTKETK